LTNEKSPQAFDVIAFGGIDIDWLFQMKKLPSYDEKVSAELVGLFPGGPVGNFACIGSHLGSRVAAYCTVGDDDGGRTLIEDFQKNQVDTSFVTIKKGYTTPFVIVEVDDCGEKAVIVPRLPEMIDTTNLKAALSKTKYIYLFPNDTRLFVEIASLAKGYGVKVMVDIEATADLKGKELFEVLSYTDIASFNEAGFEYSTGKEFRVESARELLDHGPETVLVTRGNRGVVGIQKQECVDQPAFNVPVKDTTGAGDTFNAAFLFSTLKGKSLRESLMFSSAAAALVISSVGTRTTMPTAADVEKFIHTNKTKGDEHV
jgi:ribokinase/sulfofructose kinase